MNALSMPHTIIAAPKITQPTDSAPNMKQKYKTSRLYFLFRS